MRGLYNLKMTIRVPEGPDLCKLGVGPGFILAFNFGSEPGAINMDPNNCGYGLCFQVQGDLYHMDPNTRWQMICKLLCDYYIQFFCICLVSVCSMPNSR